MLPSVENIDDLVLDFDDETSDNTKTFGINLNENIVDRMIDGLEAIRQTILLLLNIESDQYIIYPYTYGLKTIDLYGKPNHYVMAVLPERIKETLLTDNRITDVSDFEFEVERNKITVKFVVKTIYGDVNSEKEVAY